jgi:hypothetical protein
MGFMDDVTAIKNKLALTKPPVTLSDLQGQKKLDEANQGVASQPMSITPPTSTTVTPTAPQPQATAEDFNAQAPNSGPPTPAPAGATAEDFNAPQAQPAPVEQPPQISQAGGSMNIGAPTQTPTPVPNQSYGQASTDPNTGLPSAAGSGLTKLGKLFTLLRIAGTGAAEGSQGHNFGQGFAMAQQAQDQQQAQNQAMQQHQMSLATQRAQLQFLPTAQAFQQLMLQKNAEWKQSQTDANEAHAGQQVAAAGRQDQLKDSGAAKTAATAPMTRQFGSREMSYSPKDPNANSQGWVDAGAAPTKSANAQVKVMGNRSMQYVPATDTTPEHWMDVGAAPIQHTSNASASPSDAKDIADAIERGDQAPTMQGLYRMGAPVRGELARRGFNLANAQSDWTATQKYLSSLNGPQQLRVHQAVSTAGDSLDKIDSLYKEWQDAVPLGTSGVKAYNHAALIASKNLPGRAGAVAQALDSNIADLTSDLAVVYMGGNSPSDKAIGLAKENLSSDWNKETFEEGIKQAHLNIGIRSNSMKNGLPSGVSPASPYIQRMPGAGNPAAAAGAATPATATPATATPAAKPKKSFGVAIN